MSEYRICDASQGTPEWFETRKKLKATASKFGTIYLYSQGKCPRNWITDKCPPNYAMQMGIACEPIVREWFQTSSWWQDDWKMKEVGIAIPSFDPRIGGSVDGLIEKDNIPIGIIEIKCPQTMYTSLFNQKQTSRERIHLSHYAQMQGELAILNLPFCYYIVFGHGQGEDGSVKEPEMYVERVERDISFWEKELYPSILSYIQETE